MARFDLSGQCICFGRLAAPIMADIFIYVKAMQLNSDDPDGCRSLRRRRPTWSHAGGLLCIPQRDRRAPLAGWTAGGLCRHFGGCKAESQSLGNLDRPCRRRTAWMAVDVRALVTHAALE